MMADFDRFDICEAWHIWACEWGEYSVVTRLTRMGFRPSPMLCRDSLSENADVILQALNARSEANPDWYTRP